MSRNQTGSVICIRDVHRIPIKSLLLTAYPKRRWINQSTDRPLSLILERKASFVHLAFSDTHDDPRLRENNLRLWNMKISF